MTERLVEMSKNIKDSLEDFNNKIDDFNKELNDISDQIRQAEKTLKTIGIEFHWITPGDNELSWEIPTSRTNSSFRLCFDGSPFIERKVADRIANIQYLPEFIDAFGDYIAERKFFSNS